MRSACRVGSRGDTRRVETLYFFGCFLAWISVLGEGMHLVGEWITCLLGSTDCTVVIDATLLAVMVQWEMGLVSFGSLLGPQAGLVKRVASVAGGARSSRTFFLISATRRN